VDRREGGRAFVGLRDDAVEQAMLEYTRTAGHQIHRNAHAGMHVTDHALGGDQRVDAVRGSGENLLQPALHRRFQAQPHLVVREEAAGARVFEQHVVEMVGQPGRALRRQASQQCRRRRRRPRQRIGPGQRQRLAGLIKIWNVMHDCLPATQAVER